MKFISLKTRGESVFNKITMKNRKCNSSLNATDYKKVQNSLTTQSLIKVIKR